MTLTNIAVGFFAVTFVIEKVLLWGHKAKTKTNWDRGSLLVFDITGVLSVPAGMLLGYTHYGRMHAGVVPVSLVGLLLMLTGTTVRWSAIFTLQRLFTVNVSILENHQIVQHGLYRYLRHPSYTGLLLRYFGFGLAFANWLSLLLIFLPLFCAVCYRIQVEEQALLRAFGRQYADYASRTRRLIPRVY
jgi:protein-S-isoprenylcysteine O-methyltransferase Ste14